MVLFLTTNSRRRPQTQRYCNPTCQFFKCSKRALGPKKKVRGRLRITCNFVEGDFCTGSRCTYSFCAKHKLRTDGTCGLVQRPQSKQDDEIIEQKYEKELIKKEKENNQYKIYLKDKYRKKFEEKKW